MSLLSEQAGALHYDIASFYVRAHKAIFDRVRARRTAEAVLISC